MINLVKYFLIFMVISCNEIENTNQNHALNMKFTQDPIATSEILSHAVKDLNFVLTSLNLIYDYKGNPFIHPESREDFPQIQEDIKKGSKTQAFLKIFLDKKKSSALSTDKHLNYIPLIINIAEDIKKMVARLRSSGASESPAFNTIFGTGENLFNIVRSMAGLLFEKGDLSSLYEEATQAGPIRVIGFLNQSHDFLFKYSIHKRLTNQEQIQYYASEDYINSVLSSPISFNLSSCVSECIESFAKSFNAFINHVKLKAGLNTEEELAYFIAKYHEPYGVFIEDLLDFFQLVEQRREKKAIALASGMLEKYNTPYEDEGGKYTAINDFFEAKQIKQNLLNACDEVINSLDKALSNAA